MRVIAIVLSLLLGGAALASAGPLSCSASVASTPPARAEGLAELIGDLVLTCTGGTPTGDGAPVPRVNVTMFLNTTPTSRVLSAPWAEPLLLVDDPAPEAQRACDVPDGHCAVLGTGTGVSTYDGSPGRPNVFQGQQSGNAIAWPGVPIDPPGDGARILRLTNVRVNASRLAGSAASPSIAALVTASGEISLPITNPNQTLGSIAPSVTMSLRNALSTAPLSGVVALPQCGGATRLRIATVRFAERFASAFRKRSAATSFPSPTPIASQNVPGVAAVTETGFLNTALVGHAARGALGAAGLADFGTRLKAVLAGVPPGVSVFVDASGASVGGAAENTARLTAVETAGFLPAGEADGIPGTTPVALDDGAGSAVWEITDADPLAAHAIEFGVYVSYAPDAPVVGTATIRGGLAPTGAEGDRATPRFADQDEATPLFSVTACDGAPALTAAILPSSRSVKIGATATVFATVINLGSDTATGCRVTPMTTLAATFAARTTDGTNQVTGTPPVDIPIGMAQSFVLSLKPTAAMTPSELRFSFDCANSEAAPVIAGVNTLLFSAAGTVTPDIVALVATPSRDGIATIPGAAGTAAFAVATINLGGAGAITVSADTAGATLPVRTYVCETDPVTGSCLAAPAATVTAQVAANATPTFAVFVAGSGAVGFLPTTNRVFVRFKDSAGVTRGSTSVAVKTE